MPTLSDTLFKTALSALISLMSFCSYAQAEYTEEYHGIDVSNHQGRIDWHKVATDDNVQFVYIKATEGATYVSPTFEQNIRDARKAGLKVGCYHFLRATSYIHDQFKNFIERCRKDEQDLAPLIDIEVKGRWTAKQVADSVMHFADLLEQHYGVRPVIYTGTNFFNRYLAHDFSEGYELFIAKYSEDEPILANNVQYTLWQFTDCGEVRGINTDVDQSRFNFGKSLNDILFNPAPRDSNFIGITRMKKPIISMNMQNPAKFKNRRDEKIRKEQEKQRLNEEKVARKRAETHKGHAKRHPRSDIDDEDDYMPTPAQSTAKSTRSKS